MSIVRAAQAIGEQVKPADAELASALSGIKLKFDDRPLPRIDELSRGRDNLLTFDAPPGNGGASE